LGCKVIGRFDFLGIRTNEPTLLWHSPLKLEVLAFSNLLDLEYLWQYLDSFCY
jgi:hypothetical protein